MKRFRFWTRNFEMCHQLKKKLHSKKRVLIWINPWKWRSLHFLSPSEKHDFELGTLQCVLLGIQNLAKSQIFCLKSLQGVTHWNKTSTKFQILKIKIETCQKLKKTLHSKNHVLIYVTTWRRRVLHFRCHLENHDFELEILQCVTLGIHRFGFCNKKLKTSQNLNWSWQSKNLVLIYVTPWKRHNLRFSCFIGW